MEKSYQRQRARAEEKAMRLQASKDVGMHHHHKKKKKKKQGSGASSNGFGTYQGALPTTRSHPRNGGIKAKQSRHSSSSSMMMQMIMVLINIEIITARRRAQRKWVGEERKEEREEPGRIRQVCV